MDCYIPYCLFIMTGYKHKKGTLSFVISDDQENNHDFVQLSHVPDNIWVLLWHLLLTWFNFNPSMDK